MKLIAYVNLHTNKKCLAIAIKNSYTLLRFKDGSRAWFCDRWMKRDFRQILQVCGEE
jgi:hypothetical protein